jgi:DNA-binding GntR family transcriptional regulator
MEEQGYNISFTLIEFCEVWPSEGVQRELGLRKGQRVTKLKRVKKVEKEVIGLDVLFMPLEIGTSLEKMNLSDFSLVEFLNWRNNDPSGRAVFGGRCLDRRRRQRRLHGGAPCTGTQP